MCLCVFLSQIASVESFSIASQLTILPGSTEPTDTLCRCVMADVASASSLPSGSHSEFGDLQSAKV